MSLPPPVRPRRAVSPLLIFALGLMLGRLSGQLPEGPRGLVNLLIAGLVAVSVTIMWRRWARHAMEKRRREQLDRQARSQQAKDKA